MPTAKPRAKTIYIPGEGTYAWRMYSYNQREALQAVPKTKTGKWTQAAVRAYYFQSAPYDDALARTLALREKWRALSDKHFAQVRSNSPTEKRKAPATLKHAQAMSKDLSLRIEAFEFGYKPTKQYKESKDMPSVSAPSYYKAPEKKAPRAKKAPAKPRVKKEGTPKQRQLAASYLRNTRKSAGRESAETRRAYVAARSDLEHLIKLNSSLAAKTVRRRRAHEIHKENQFFDELIPPHKKRKH